MNSEQLKEKIETLKQELSKYDKAEIEQIIQKYDDSHYVAHDCPLWYECTEQERNK